MAKKNSDGLKRYQLVKSLLWNFVKKSNMRNTFKHKDCVAFASRIIKSRTLEHLSIGKINLKQVMAACADLGIDLFYDLDRLPAELQIFDYFQMAEHLPNVIDTGRTPSRPTPSGSKYILPIGFTIHLHSGEFGGYYTINTAIPYLYTHSDLQRTINFCNGYKSKPDAKGNSSSAKSGKVTWEGYVEDGKGGGKILHYILHLEGDAAINVETVKGETTIFIKEDGFPKTKLRPFNPNAHPSTKGLEKKNLPQNPNNEAENKADTDSPKDTDTKTDTKADNKADTPSARAIELELELEIEKERTKRVEAQTKADNDRSDKLFKLIDMADKFKWSEATLNNMIAKL